MNILGQISQAQLIEQSAEDDLENDVGWKLEEVEWSAGPLIELPSAVATPEDGVAEIGRVVQVPDAGRLAMRADHGAEKAIQSTKLAELFPELQS